MEYRLGQFSKAVADYQKELDFGPFNGQASRDSAVRVILAMSLQQLGRVPEAKSQLTQARETIQQVQKHSDGHSGSWFDWSIARILLREAEQTIPQG